MSELFIWGNYSSLSRHRDPWIQYSSQESWGHRCDPFLFHLFFSLLDYYTSSFSHSFFSLIPSISHLSLRLTPTLRKGDNLIYAQFRAFFDCKAVTALILNSTNKGPQSRHAIFKGFQCIR